MTNERGDCVDYGNELTHLDDDPNRTCGSTCKRCLAEQAHDYDAEPGVEFTKTGERVVPAAPREPGTPKSIRDALASIDRLPQRQDGLNDQLRDLKVIADHFGLYDAADFLRISLEKR